MTRIIAGRARGARLDVPGVGTRPTSDRVRESLFGVLESMDALEGARVLDLYAGSGALGLEAWSRGAVSIDLVERSRPAAVVVGRNVGIVAKAMAVPGASASGSGSRSGSGPGPVAKAHQSAVSIDLVERSRPAAVVVGRNVGIVAKAMAVPADSASGSGSGPAAKVHQSAVRSFLGRAAGPFDLVFIDPPYDLGDGALDADLLALAPLLSSHAVVVVERGRRAAVPDLESAGLALLRQKTYGDTALWWAEPISPAES